METMDKDLFGNPIPRDYGLHTFIVDATLTDYNKVEYRSVSVKADCEDDAERRAYKALRAHYGQDYDIDIFACNILYELKGKDSY